MAMPGRLCLLCSTGNLPAAVVSLRHVLARCEHRITPLTDGHGTALGLVHADQDVRDTLAMDIRNLVRPNVDRYTGDLVLAVCLHAANSYRDPSGHGSMLIAYRPACHGASAKLLCRCRRGVES